MEAVMRHHTFLIVALFITALTTPGCQKNATSPEQVVYSYDLSFNRFRVLGDSKVLAEVYTSNKVDTSDNVRRLCVNVTLNNEVMFTITTHGTSILSGPASWSENGSYVIDLSQGSQEFAVTTTVGNENFTLEIQFRPNAQIWLKKAEGIEPYKN